MNKRIVFILGVLLGIAFSAITYFFGHYKDEKKTEKTYVEPTGNIPLEDIQYVEKPKEKRSTQIETVVIQDTVFLSPKAMQERDSGEYVVLRDKLLHTQRITILKNSGSNTSSASDKLSERMSSDDFFVNQLSVEFWESPINYQGYRLNKSKLILFGINPNESFMLSLNEPGVLLMQAGEFTTLLQPTEKYRSFNFQ
jgi:hypothetical protein